MNTDNIMRMPDAPTIVQRVKMFAYEMASKLYPKKTLDARGREMHTGHVSQVMADAEKIFAWIMRDDAKPEIAGIDLHPGDKQEVVENNFPPTESPDQKE